MSNLSLIKHIAEDDLVDNLAISLYTLVRDWVRFRIEGVEQRTFAIEASCVVYDCLSAHTEALGICEIPRMISTPEPLNASTYSMVVRDIVTEMTAHLDRCVADLESLRINFKDLLKTMEQDPLEMMFAICFESLRQPDKSVSIFERLLAMLREEYGRDH